VALEARNPSLRSHFPLGFTRDDDDTDAEEALAEAEDLFEKAEDVEAAEEAAEDEEAREKK